MAVKKDYQENALFNLGFYYVCKTQNYDKVKKYLNIAVRKKHTESVFLLAYYYWFIEKNFNKMEEYVLIAYHEHKHLDALLGLSQYYNSIHDTDNTIKYYELYNKDKKNN